LTAGVTPNEIGRVRPQLLDFAERMLTDALPRKDRRAKGESYLRGLLTDGQRKSMQPMAQRLGVDHQGLQRFVTSSTWDYEVVRANVARWGAVDAPPSLVRPSGWTSLDQPRRHPVMPLTGCCIPSPQADPGLGAVLRSVRWVWTATARGAFGYEMTLGWSITHNQVPSAWRRPTSTVTTPKAGRKEPLTKRHGRRIACQEHRSPDVRLVRGVARIWRCRL
jgi:hypothetical protein